MIDVSSEPSLSARVLVKNETPLQVLDAKHVARFPFAQYSSYTGWGCDAQTYFRVISGLRCRVHFDGPSRVFLHSNCHIEHESCDVRLLWCDN